MQLRRICRFGDFELDLEQRVLTNAGEPIPLPPRCLAVLIVLAEARGATVGKDELIASVWKRDVSDSAVTITMHNLRTRLGPNGERLIETITGVGYRLVINPAETSEIKSEVQTADLLPRAKHEDVPRAVDGAAAQSTQRHQGAYMSALALLTLGLIVAAAASSFLAQPRIAVYDQLTNDGRPKFAPLFADRGCVYFFENDASGHSAHRLAAVPIGGGDTRFVDTPGSDSALLDIGPEGEFLIRTNRSAASGMLVLWSSYKKKITPLGGSDAEVGAISPNMKWIATACDRRITIRQSDANAQEFSAPGRVSWLRWSPDGTRVRYGIYEPFYESHRIWECNRDGSGLHVVLDPTPFRGLELGDWTHDGSLFLFRQFNEKTSDLWARSEERFHTSKPIRLTSGPLYLEAFRPSVSDSSKVFVIGRAARGELLSIDAQTRAATPFLGGISAIDINFSRDAQWVCYQHFPDHTLWRSRRDGTDARRLTTPGVEVWQPHWSPDGRHIAFMGIDARRRTRIYIVGTDGGPLEALKPNDEFDQGVPSWSNDGARIVFGELLHRKAGNEMMIHLIDVKTREETVIPDSAGKWTPRWSPDGRSIVAQSPDMTKMYLYDLARQGWRTLVDGLQRANDPTWSFNSQYVYFRHYPKPDQMIISRVNVKSAVIETVATSTDLPRLYWDWFEVAPDRSLLVLRSIDIEEVYALRLT